MARAAASAVVVVAVGANVGVAFPGPTFPGGNGRIAFGSADGIYSVDPEGGTPTRLTGGSRHSPVWSPDGSSIAFVREVPERGTAVYVMNEDGTSKRRITRFQKWIDYAIWSPTGETLFYVQSRVTEGEPDQAVIKRINVSGSGGRRLTEWGERAYSPAVSPDGAKVAYVSNGDGDYEVMVVDVDGSNNTKLTSNSVYDGEPAWSQDGTRIAVRRAIAKGRRETGAQIVSIDVTGSGEIELTDGSRWDVWHSWAPNDSSILFVGESREGNAYRSDLFTVAADGSAEVRLTDTPEAEMVPVWSPDGTKIAYNVHPADEPLTYIYVIDADGTGAKQVPGTGRSGNYFDWQSQPTP